MQSFTKSILSFLTLVWLASGAAAQTIYVNACATEPGDGSPSRPYKTVAEAVNAAPPGSMLIVQAGAYPELLPPIDKNLTITASGGPALIGGSYVGKQEVCVRVTQRRGEFDSSLLVNCADDPPGVHALVYYPAKDPGGTQIACGGPFPALVYAHGMRGGSLPGGPCPWSDPIPLHEDYRQTEGILYHLAAAGMVVISVDVSWGLNYIARGSIVINTIAYLRDANQTSGSLLENAVDLHRVALSGHSMGGAGAVHASLNLREPPFDALGLSGVDIRALALLAPADGIITNLQIPPEGMPLLVIWGTNDNENSSYGQLYPDASAPKHLVIVTGANHWGYTDGLCGGLCEVGGVTGQEAHRRQQLTARRYMETFFSYYLRGDASQLDYLVQQSGQQCGQPPGNPPACGAPRRSFSDLDNLNVQVSVCSCISP